MSATPFTSRRWSAPLHLVAWVLATLVSTALPGEEAVDLFAPRFEWRQWKPEQGLPDNAVETLYQASNGWLWLGTRKGLARFDGVEFTCYNSAERGFADEAVTALGEDDRGAIWVGTKCGAFVFRQGALVRPDVANPLFHQSVRALVPARSPGLWMVTTRMVSLFQGGRWEHWAFTPTELENWPFAEPPQLFTLAEDAHGTLWVGSDAGLYRLERTARSWTRLWSDTHPPEGRGEHHQIVRTVATRSDGSVWFSSDRVLWRLAPGGSLSQIPIPRGVGDARARRLWETPDGLELVAGGRIYRLADGQLSPIMFGPGQDDAFVTDGLKDRDGTRWLATRYGGLVQLRQPRVLVFTTRDGLPQNNVFSVCPAAHGGLWVATGGGLAELSGGRFETVAIPGFEPTQAWQVVREDSQGDLWLGANPSGIRWLTHPTNNLSVEAGPGTRFVPGYIERTPGDPYTFAIRGGSARTIYEDRQGRIWAGRLDGLFVASAGARQVRFLAGEPLAGRILTSRRPYRWYLGTGGICETDWGKFSPGRGTHATPYLELLNSLNLEPVRAPSLDDAVPPIPWLALPPNAEVRAILEDRAGRFWFGTPQGLASVNQGTTRIFTRQDGLAGDAIETLHEDPSGAIWVGTRTGLSRFGPAGWFTFNPACGLEETEFNQIIEDDHEALWFGGQRGLTRVLRTELEAVVEGRSARVSALHLGEADGMLNAETMGGSQPSAARTPDGRLWFATGQGLAMVHPASLPLAKSGPVPFVELLVAEGERTEIQSSVPSDEASRLLELKPGSGRSLEIHYTALDYAAPERIRFEYEMAGHDDRPVSAGHRRVAYFTNLRPGDYRFRVRAANHDGRWSTGWAETPFRIQPFAWETWWFRAGVALGLSLLVASLVRWRLRELRRFAHIERENRIREERERIARDLHDDVAANLTLITMLQPTPDASAAGTDGRALDRRAAVLADAALDNLGELVWATNPRFDSLDNLAAYLRELAHRLLAGSTLQPILNFPASIPSIPVSGEFRRHSVMIVKESIHNALKHAQAQNLTLELRLEQVAPGPSLTLVISDDGIGSATGENAPAGPTALGGNGFLNMQTRVEQLSGTLQVVSKAGEGTRITVTLPLPQVGVR